MSLIIFYCYFWLYEFDFMDWVLAAIYALDKDDAGSQHLMFGQVSQSS